MKDQESQGKKIDEITQVNKPQPAHSLISPTAKLVAYYRQFANVPYAREVVRYTDAEQVARDLLVTGSSLARAAASTGARYHCIMREVQQVGIDQVLELGSGLSLRGLAVTRARPEVIYVETDLPGMHAEKMAVLERILDQEGQPAPPNLHCLTANALRWNELLRVAEHLDPARPVAVVHEGMAQYLKLDEKRVLAGHVRKLLERFGGVWITPDLDTREMQAKRDARAPDQATRQATIAAVSRLTQRPFEDNHFDTQAALEEFLTGAGFAFDCTAQWQDGPGQPPLSDEEKAFVELERLWILRLG